MDTFFVIVNATSKMAEQYPDTTGLITEAQKLQWINDMVNGGGMNANQELVASNEPTVRPSVDENLLDIVETRAYANVSHPVYAMLKQWQITYSEPTPKAVDIQKKVVDLKENEANETTIPYEKMLKLTTLAVWVLMKHLNLQTNDKINATSLSAKDKKRLRLFRRAALKIHNNDVERDNKHALIDASSLPDLTTNWDLNNFTEEV
jgi:hypothetical protein